MYFFIDSITLQNIHIYDPPPSLNDDSCARAWAVVFYECDAARSRSRAVVNDIQTAVEILTFARRVKYNTRLIETHARRKVSCLFFRCQRERWFGQRLPSQVVSKVERLRGQNGGRFTRINYACTTGQYGTVSHEFVSLKLSRARAGRYLYGAHERYYCRAVSCRFSRTGNGRTKRLSCRDEHRLVRDRQNN